MENNVDKSNKPQNLQINRRQTVNSSKEAFENYKEKKNPVKSSKPPKLQIKRDKIKIPMDNR